MYLQYFICFVGGLLAAVSQPTFFLVPFIILGYSVFLTQLNYFNNYKENFYAGLSFGIGFFSVSIHWIIFPLRLDKNYEELSFFIAFLFILSLSFFYAFSALAIRFYSLRLKVRSRFFLDVYIFSLIFFFFEILRSNILSGFPWNISAHIWGFDHRMYGIVKFIGVEALSFVTIFWVVLTSKLLLADQKISSMLSFICLPLFLILSSNIILKNSEKKESLNIRLIQPNIPQKIKWDRKHYLNNLKNLIKLSNSKTSLEEEIDLIIWPESAIPFFIENNQEDLIFFKKNFSPKQNLILGAIRKSTSNNDKLFNSFFHIKNGKIISVYDKINLVPFGEFIPFRKLIPLKKITEGSTDFSKGLDKKLLRLKNNNIEIYIQPSICYEGIFPYNITTTPFPNVIINITNDAWFGATTGPGQHLTATRFRALEIGLPLIRVANTGISGFYNQNGKAIKSLGLNERGKIDAKVFFRSDGKVAPTNKIIILLFLIFFIAILCISKDFLKKNS